MSFIPNPRENVKLVFCSDDQKLLHLVHVWLNYTHQCILPQTAKNGLQMGVHISLVNQSIMIRTHGPHLIKITH